MSATTTLPRAVTTRATAAAPGAAATPGMATGPATAPATAPAARAKPRVGVFGLTSCAGDQLALINCEDELLAIVGAVDLRSFVMAQSANDETEFDVAFIEGSVVTKEDEERAKDIRAKSRLVVAIGTCAAWGGIPGSVNDRPRGELYRLVYGSPTDLFGLGLGVRPLAAVIRVDAVIPGCPVEKHQLLSALASLLHGDAPLLPSYPVCLECRFAENLCLLKHKDLLCCGPVTVGGCKARCPSHGVPCEGCRGPVAEANFASEIGLLEEKGFTRQRLEKAMRTYAFASDLARSQ